MSNETNGNLTSKPVVRLCHLIKWPDYSGYGFNLHANLNKPGHFIANVEEGSPAQAAGLKDGDKIIEVNGININGEVHKQVVSRIKQNPNETKLLVVDKESSEYFQSNNITITGTMAEVIMLKTPSKDNNQTQTQNQTNSQNEVMNGNKTTEENSNGESQQQSESGNNNNSSSKEEKCTKLNLNMTVNEYRSKLASRKKYDPKKEAMDVKKKHEIIDTL